MGAIVICRQVSDELLPGYEGGYECALCRKPLQVSTPSRSLIAAGGTPFCNACGLRVATIAKRLGQITDFAMTDVAKAQLDEMKGTGN